MGKKEPKQPCVNHTGIAYYPKDGYEKELANIKMNKEYFLSYCIKCNYVIVEKVKIRKI